MILTIYFDGKEAVVDNPSETLIKSVANAMNLTDDIISKSQNRTLGKVNINTKTNCSSILVSPSRVTGNTFDLWIRATSIAAVRLASPTSQEGE